MLRHLALVEDDVLLRVDAGGEEGGGDFPSLAHQLLRAAPDRDRLRDRVHVDDAIDAVVGILQRDEPLNRAEIVAEMQVPGRLHAGKYPLLERRHDKLR